MHQPRTVARSRFGLLASAALTGLAFLLGACTSTPKPVPLTSEQRELNLQSIDMVHGRIKQRHYDPEKVGAAWDAKHAEMRAVVAEAKTQGEARAAMTQLIESLNQTHFSIVPVEAYTDVEPDSEENEKEKETKAGAGEIGIDVRRLGDQAVVTAVSPSSPAARAGVRPGFAIESVDGRPTSRLIKQLNAIDPNRAGSAFMAVALLQTLGHGDVGKARKYVFLAENDRRINVTIEPAPPEGIVQRFGNMPEMRLKINRRIVPPGVGVFAFNMWFGPPQVFAEFESLLKECDSCQGFIIDLRGNIGGIGAMTMGLGRHFITEPDQKLGTMIQREGRLNFVLNPSIRPFTKPLAILIDESSASASEIFAGGMQDLGRARVFGKRTPGAALPAIVEIMPNRDRLYYAFANYISAKGQMLEGHGVIPDEPVEPTREALLAGGDPILDAAIAWITSQSTSNNPSTR